MLVHYGNPAWYQQHVIPYREKLFPKLQNTNRNLPTTREDIRVELEKARVKRLTHQRDKEAPGETSTG
ncbi:hypothetical protein FRC18_010362 [Serendipita sp. 400]|nr:hypothetical protein FRC18_010362 [Serendipita sp. 400]